MKLPKLMVRRYMSHGKKYVSTFELTPYGSYIPTDMYGMAAAKNACSYKQLVKLGYKPE